MAVSTGVGAPQKKKLSFMPLVTVNQTHTHILENVGVVHVGIRREKKGEN